MAQHSAEYKPEIKTPKKNNTKIIAIVVAIVVVIAAVCGIAFAMSGQQSSQQADGVDQMDVSDGKVTNPIDFAAYQSRNGDVYAWLNVPDTKVDKPILQHETKDNYYLYYDIDGNENAGGELYTQMANAKDFTDPVTVVYGHTYETKDEMMTQLHKYEDAEFFNTHPYFYVYTPTQILTYEVVSAFEYDNRHIINSFDFSNDAQTQEFFDYVMNPTDTEVKNVREDVTLTAGEDNVIVLSTCTQPADNNKRFLVVGVLTDTQETA